MVIILCLFFLTFCRLFKSYEAKSSIGQGWFRSEICLCQVGVSCLYLSLAYKAIAIAIVNAVEIELPVAPCGPVGPVLPCGPCSPWIPIPAGPVAPVDPCAPVAPCGPVAPASPVAPRTHAEKLIHWPAVFPCSMRKVYKTALLTLNHLSPLDAPVGAVAPCENLYPLIVTFPV